MKPSGTVGRAADAEVHRLRQRVLDLEALNAELEAFASAASHDLRSPVGLVNGLCAALLDDCGATLETEALEYIAMIRQQTVLMAERIDSLLRFCRVGQLPLASEAVDLSSLARASVERLMLSEPSRRVAVRIDDDLVAQGDPYLLQIVVDNLVGNAWKFTARKRRARVRVGVHETDAGLAYYVRDNGAGFDMRRATRLFQAFQRLHSSGEFPGTGVGLATAERIVRRHGGRMWAEATLGRGATFYFTLGNEPAESRRGRVLKLGAWA